MTAMSILTTEDVALEYDLSRSLSSRTGIELRVARSAWEVIQAAQLAPPTLFVLHYWMPDLLGDETLELLRNQLPTHDIPVVMIAPGIGSEGAERLERMPPLVRLSESLTREQLLGEISELLRIQNRRQRRINLALPIELRTPQWIGTGVTCDLSLGGATIETRLELVDGQTLQLSFAQSGGERPPSEPIKATVRRVTGKPGSRVIGVEFGPLPQSIEKFLEERLRGSQALMDIIARIDRLPALPAVASRILEESLKENAEFAIIVSLIRSDPALTAYILKLANSAAYRAATPITTVDRAALIMGLKAIQHAVLGVTIFRHMSQDQRGARAQTLWRHSLACGQAAELLAPRFQLPPDEAFTLGLLHDLGKFLLLAEVEHEKNHQQLLAHWTLEREVEMFGMSHALIGAQILGRWRVPARIVQVVAHHHDRDLSALDEMAQRFVGLVRAADRLTYLCLMGSDHGLDDGLDALGTVVQQHEVETLCEHLFRGFTQIAELFGKPIDPAVLCAELVERANLRLSQELNLTLEQNELLRRAYERTHRELVNLAQFERLNLFGRISAGVAHEINSPLATVTTELDEMRAALAQASRNPPAASPALGDLLNSFRGRLNRIDDQVHQCKTLARALESLSPEAHLHREPGNLMDCIEQALFLLRTSVSEAIQIVWVANRLPDLLMDHNSLVRVFFEVMHNSIGAMPAGGRLEISTRQIGNQQAILLSDTGLGIHPDNLSRIFEPFFTTHPRGRGRGLGLSIVHGIVSRMGGQVLVSSAEGRGTQVEIRLPVRPLNGKG